jgi:hypothetical protein
MKTLLTLAALATFATAAAPSAHAACDIKKAAADFIEKGLAKEHAGLNSIDKITHQGGDMYFVEFTYGGTIDDSGSYTDSGAATIRIDLEKCKAYKK